MERTQVESVVMATGCAEKHGNCIFLVDPNWTADQREKFAAIRQSKIQNPKSKIQKGWLCIPTGGSSGGLRFTRHDEQTLTAAVEGFCQHFSIKQVNAIDVLPPWHVSGLMSRVRCAVTGGRYVSWDWKSLQTGDCPELMGDEVLSLVPTQLQRLLSMPSTVKWLRQLRLILIGGGPSWPALSEAVAKESLPVVFSYGMTETAAMVAAQTPVEFFNGDRSSGLAMPHVTLEICDEKTGLPKAAGERGIVRVSGESVMRGYYPDESADRSLVTSDFGLIDETGHLHIEGRQDDIIITGGEKVNPREVETALRSASGVDDLVVLGVPHHEWGEEVVVCFVACDESREEQSLRKAAQMSLKKHQCPKRYLGFAKSDWPSNEQGKVNREVLRRLVLVDPSRQV